MPKNANFGALQMPPCGSAMTIPANSIATVLAFGGFRGRSPLGERVAALRQAQGPWDLWLAKESEGETSPFKKNRAGLLTNWIFEFIFSAQVCSLWRFYRLYARGVDDEERCCGQCGRGRDLFSNPPHCPIDNL